MLRQNRTILIIALVALVNMLGYGIIIPLLYGYSKQFGLTDFQNGLLFALFSICQFISTPIIGRLSDRYGRRPLLLLSISGTALSFFLLAFARSAFFLFAARIVDGLTAGNIPVAYAVISDTTKTEDRTRAFAIVGAAFSFGFVFGPAIAAFTVGFGREIPFIIAGVVAIAAVLLTALYLPETNTNLGEVKKGKLIDFPLLWHTLFDREIGATFAITLAYYMAFSAAIIYGFQPFTMNILRLNQTENATLFTTFGIVGLISQTFLVQRASWFLGLKRAFTVALVATAAAFAIMYIAPNLDVFVGAMTVLAFANSVVQTLIPTILSREAHPTEQGSVMGLNASYQSIGMILGPIIGGVVATLSTRYPFIAGTAIVLPCYFLTQRILRSADKNEEKLSDRESGNLAV